LRECGHRIKQQFRCEFILLGRTAKCEIARKGDKIEGPFAALYIDVR
jgi:hypothetical protein